MILMNFNVYELTESINNLFKNLYLHLTKVGLCKLEVYNDWLSISASPIVF